MKTIKHGDFTQLAEQYIYRPGYSYPVLRALISYIRTEHGIDRVADVGAGTGKLTEILADLGLQGYAVEPNDAMRREALRMGTSLQNFSWSTGTAEQTDLPDSSVDWVCMASSFHWTDKKAALAEFHRILRGNGFFTALWNPRDIERSELHMEIEDLVRYYVPDLKRVSSGLHNPMSGIQEDLLSTGHFRDVLFMEASHEIEMSKERYINIWRSVNDIQVQAGPERFEKLIKAIERKIEHLDMIVVPYKTRAWTVQAR